jgi:adenylate kinase family enzyme
MEIEKESVFLLTSSTPDDKKKFGTGFAFAYMEHKGKLFILTCAHVVDDLEDKVKIKGQEATVEAKGSRDTIDLALLSIPWSSSPPSLLNQIAEGKTDRKFQVCGYSSAGHKSPNILRTITGKLGQSICFGDDHIEAWDIHVEGDELSNLQDGYSGSPLCDDGGQLIAVVSHKINNGQRGYAIAISNIKIILQEKSYLSDLHEYINRSMICSNETTYAISSEFLSFLNNTDMLEKVHAEKESVTLEDIFVYPQLRKYDSYREYEKKVSSEFIIYNIDKYKKVIISGESQSGKTTLCKKIYFELHSLNYIPVYISSDSWSHAFHGKIVNKIEQALTVQYGNEISIETNRKRIVVILDNFYLADSLRRERQIQALSDYRQIIIVDDIFHINMKNDRLLESFSYFRIEEFTPSLRNQLIEKWINITERGNSCRSQNLTYQKIDENTELVNTTLGKIFGNGIMPAYPFFILSIITTYEAFSTPLDQEITSQGHCYQAFIYLFLRKNNVKNDEIDTYINFLTELSFFFFSNNKKEISGQEFDRFMESYLDKYNLPLDKYVLIDKLLLSRLIERGNLENYSFCYQYLYYFFVAKYFSDNIDKEKDNISKNIENLHKKENAYISIFISHHSRNDYFFDEIWLNASFLFDNHRPATLDRSELDFFDKQERLIIKAMLPKYNGNPERARNERLKYHDEIEEKNDKEDEKYDEIDDNLIINIRKSVKTVEVMGCIIKNRAGSLQKERIESFLKEAIKVHLRILSSFFDIIKDDKNQIEIVDFVNKKISDLQRERTEEGRTEKRLTEEEIEAISKKLFWNLNFKIIYIILHKTIQSLGSKKLMKIIEKVCEEEKTPASFLIRHGVLMWKCKELQIENIGVAIENEEFSYISKQLLKIMIIEYCSLHQMNFKEKGRISNKLNIPSKKLLKLSEQT